MKFIRIFKRLILCWVCISAVTAVIGLLFSLPFGGPFNMYPEMTGRDFGAFLYVFGLFCTMLVAPVIFATGGR